MAVLRAAPHTVLSEPLHLGFLAVLLARALTVPLLLSPVVASDKAHTEASPTCLPPQAAALLDPGPRLPARARLDLGAAGVLGHLEVSRVLYFTRLVDPLTNLGRLRWFFIRLSYGRSIGCFRFLNSLLVRRCFW